MMKPVRSFGLPALLLGGGWLLFAGVAASAAGAGEPKQPEKKAEKKAEKKTEEKTEVLFKKTGELTEDDPKDTKLKTSFRKVFPVKMEKGTAYRIDLSSKAFDTFLRLEDSRGRELAFNDDIDLRNKNLDSRLFFIAPKTGEYNLIVTTYNPGDKGEFELVMKLCSKDEIPAAQEAALLARAEGIADSPPAEQKQLIDEVTKRFEDREKNKDLNIKDLQLALTLVMGMDDSQPDLVRKTGESFIKIFDNADDKKIAQLGTYLRPTLKQLDRIGKEIEIAGKTADGKEFDLKDLKGKVVLVDFWATWCGPCIQELPNVLDAHKKFNSKGFEVIGVSLDRKDEAITKFLEARKLPWTSINVEDSRKLADKYGVNAIPLPILVGRDGRIVSMRARGPRLETLLERLTSEKK